MDHLAPEERDGGLHVRAAGALECTGETCTCRARDAQQAFGPGGCVRPEPPLFPGMEGETTQTLQMQPCPQCGHDPELCAAAAELGIDLGAPLPRKDLNAYAAESHEDNMQWWMPLDPHVEVDGQVLIAPKLVRNKGELLMLIVSEIAEAMEGVRKDIMDDKLPHRKMEEVELADALIRIFDYAGAHGLDIEGAYQEKRAYNKERADHKVEARKGEGGKQF